MYLMHLFFSGFSDVNNNSLPIQDALNDSLRLKYHQLHTYDIEQIHEYSLSSNC